MSVGRRDEICPLLFDIVVDAGEGVFPKACAGVFKDSKELERFMINRSVITLAVLESCATGMAKVTDADYSSAVQVLSTNATKVHALDIGSAPRMPESDKWVTLWSDLVTAASKGGFDKFVSGETKRQEKEKSAWHESFMSKPSSTQLVHVPAEPECEFPEGWVSATEILRGVYTTKCNAGIAEGAGASDVKFDADFFKTVNPDVIRLLASDLENKLYRCACDNDSDHFEN
eukprot:9479152-Pyramimonas_sp.AAC.1